MNLILLTIDCLRADHLGCLGYTKQTTPNLDNIARTGILFTQAISVGPSTRPSFLAICTSTYPQMYGGWLYITASRTTIAQVLKEHGYCTAAFHTNPWVSSFFGYNKGFDTFDDGIPKLGSRRRLSMLKELVKHRIARNARLDYFVYHIFMVGMATRIIDKPKLLNQKAIAWLYDNPSNFFLWIHYMDAHEPYTPSSGFMSPLKAHRILRLNTKARKTPASLSAREVDELVAEYDARISHVDDAIGSLLATLRESGILSNTFIIITADHGQQFMEHGRHGHGNYLYDELIHVPLMIAGPGLEGKVISQQVSLLDLAPTILDLAGIEKPRAFVGNSLLPLISGDMASAGDSDAISETHTHPPHWKFQLAAIRPRIDTTHRRISLRKGKWKYIYTEGEQDELYDLDDDPKETQNVIDLQPEIAMAMRNKITAHIAFEEESAYGERDLIKASIRRLKKSGKL